MRPKFFPKPKGLSFRHVVQKFPKTRAVVHLFGVSQFVQYDIIHEMRRKQHEVARQIDILYSRTTPPTTPAGRNLDPLVSQIVTLGPFFQQYRKILAGFPFHGADNGISQ